MPLPPTECIDTAFAQEASLHHLSSFEDSVPVQKQGTLGEEAALDFKQSRRNNSNNLANTADKDAQKRDQVLRSGPVVDAMDTLLQLDGRLRRENRQQIAATMTGDH